jgi:hypothetical protein
LLKFHALYDRARQSPLSAHQLTKIHSFFTALAILFPLISSTPNLVLQSLVLTPLLRLSCVLLVTFEKAETAPLILKPFASRMKTALHLPAQTRHQEISFVGVSEEFTPCFDIPSA